MSGCEEMAEKVSAWIDGELEAHEIAAVEGHLRSCPECRGLRQRFQAVDRLAALSGSQQNPESSKASSSIGQDSPSIWLGRSARLAAAALVIIAVCLVIITSSDRADANNVETHIAALEKMNDKTLLDQEKMLKTLEWDLSAMKLAVRSTDLDTGERRKLLSKIDDLLREVERVGKDRTIRKGDSK